MQDLNHPKVRQLTREIATNLHLESSFVDFVFAKTRPSCFDNWVEDVAGGWTWYVPDEFEIAYPLWCTNADQTLILVGKAGLEFGKGWHDDADMEMISKTAQGLLTHLMNHIVEKDLSDDELRHASEFCGYRFLDSLLAFREVPLAAGVSWESAFDDLVADVDAKSR